MKAGTEPVLVVGAAIGALYLWSKVAKGAPSGRGTANTDATNEPGLGDPTVGGKAVGAYTRAYVAQRTLAFKDFGSTGVKGRDTLEIPVTPLKYALAEVYDFWQDEVNRLLNLRGDKGADRKVDLGGGPDVDLLGDGGGLLGDAIDIIGDIFVPAAPDIPATYDGVVSLDSARAILRAWDKFAAKVRSVIPTDDPFGHSDDVLTAAQADVFWDATARLAIAVEVDRAVPDFTGARYAWIALVDSAAELPGRVGEYARKVAAAASRFAFGVIWDTFWGFAASPFGLVVVGGALWWFRRDIGLVVKRVTP